MVKAPEVEFVAKDEILLEGVDEIPEDLPEEYRGKDKSAIVAEMQAMKQQIETLKAQTDSVGAMSKGIDALGQTLSKQKPTVIQQPVYQNAQQAKTKLSKDEWEKELFKRPYDLLEERDQERLAPIAQNLMEQKETLAKLEMMMNTKKKAIYDRFQEEIDAEIGNIPINQKFGKGNFYIEVVDRVAARHLDELIADGVRAQAPAAPAAPAAATRAVYSEASMTPTVAAAQAKGGSRVLSTIAQRVAQQRGMDLRDPQTKEAFSDWWFEEGRVQYEGGK